MIKNSFSVIIPIKGKASSLRLSLSNFFHKDFEVIVVNDGAENSISEAIKEFHQFLNIQEVKINPSKGSYHARNCGAKKANSEWLVFMDDGIELPDCWMSTIEPFLSNYDYICSNVKVKPSSSEKPIETLFRLTAFPCKKHFNMEGFGITAFLLVRQSILKKAGGFETVESGGDFLFGKAVSAINGRKKFIPKLIAWHEPKRLNQYIKDEIKYRTGKRLIERRYLMKPPPSLLRNFIFFGKELVKAGKRIILFWESPLWQKSDLPALTFWRSYLHYQALGLFVRIKAMNSEEKNKKIGS